MPPSPPNRHLSLSLLLFPPPSLALPGLADFDFSGVPVGGTGIQVVPPIFSHETLPKHYGYVAATFAAGVGFVPLPLSLPFFLSLPRPRWLQPPTGC